MSYFPARVADQCHQGFRTRICAGGKPISRVDNVSGLAKENGALTDKTVELIDPNALFEKLEEWERYLEADPEVAYRLRSLNEDVAEDSTSKKCDDERSPSRGSSLPNMRGPRP